MSRPLNSPPPVSPLVVYPDNSESESDDEPATVRDLKAHQYAYKTALDAFTAASIERDVAKEAYHALSKKYAQLKTSYQQLLARGRGYAVSPP